MLEYLEYGVIESILNWFDQCRNYYQVFIECIYEISRCVLSLDWTDLVNMCILVLFVNHTIVI